MAVRQIKQTKYEFGQVSKADGQDAAGCRTGVGGELVGCHANPFGEYSYCKTPDPTIRIGEGKKYTHRASRTKTCATRATVPAAEI